MAITRSDLLRHLQEAVSPEEWEYLDKGEGLCISGFNREILLEMRSADLPGDGKILEQEVSSLHKILERFLQEHLKDRPEGWKWVILSCIYLAFIAKRPMHPVDAMDIKISKIDKETIYECPQKSNGKNTTCHYCVCKRMSNYENMKRRMQKEFIKYDQDKMIQKFQLPNDAQHIYINFLGRAYRVCRTSGEVGWSEDGFIHVEEAGYNEAMTIFDVLCYSKDDCSLAGEFVNMQSLSSVHGGSMSVGNGLFRETEKAFDHKDAQLAKACERLDGIKAEKGDVAYQIPLFDFLPVMIQFWNSDEDFPASLKLSADKNMLAYMHYETVWFAVSHLLARLKEEMG